MSFYEIPRTVLMGRNSHLRSENEKLRAVLKEWLAATDARMALGSNDDRAAANVRVCAAYDQACLLIHWEGEKPPKNRSTLKRRDHLMANGSTQLSLL
jgi:hypothetical protein